MIQNERRATPSGPFWGATRRDGSLFPQDGVALHSCTLSTSRAMRLVLQKVLRKKAFRHGDAISINRF
jgi:hypothetical protein